MDCGDCFIDSLSLATKNGFIDSLSAEAVITLTFGLGESLELLFTKVLLSAFALASACPLTLIGAPNLVLGTIGVEDSLSLSFKEVVPSSLIPLHEVRLMFALIAGTRSVVVRVVELALAPVEHSIELIMAVDILGATGPVRFCSAG